MRRYYEDRRTSGIYSLTELARLIEERSDGDDPGASTSGFPLPAVGIMAIGFVLVIAVALIAAAAWRQ